MLGFPIHYSYGLRLLGFQLLGSYCTSTGDGGDLQAAFGRDAGIGL